MKDFSELRLDGVTRRFAHGEREVAALDGLTVTIRRGEFIALLGPSGCGKSTALNCIAGLLALSAGSIWLDELRIDELPPEKRGFGMVFQNYALFPHMSVRQNVGFGLRMRGVPGAEIGERVARALELVQLRAHEEKLPGQLSGGQQQRVAIARAIVVEPPLVLMDEPLSNLDARLRLEMRAEIRRIHRSLGRATIYVTHDQEEALSMADRIVVMKDGRVRQIGAPAAIYGEPADLDVARFMGYRNELAATVEHVGGTEVMLGGIDRVDQGELTIADQRIDGMSEGQLAAWRAANVGFIFQFYNLMPMLTAAQNVELPLLLTKLSKKDRAARVTTALTVVSLADRMKHRPREMSGGQQQRVAIARAIVSDPNLLLCDEPTGDLDRHSADEILTILQLLNKDLGKTIVMVTHDPAAARYAKRTLHLDKGSFVERELAA